MKYEYLTDYVPKEQLKDCLKEAGKHGWKLIKMKEVRGDWHMVYIKRSENQ